MASWPAAVAARVPASPQELGWPASRQRAPSSSLTYTCFIVCPVYRCPVHKMARSVAEITATDGVAQRTDTARDAGRGRAWPGRMTITSPPTTAAATPAWVAIRSSPHTAPASPGEPTGTAGAGRAVQLAPRLRVRAIEVHGASAHGAVPSTNASSGDTQVTE